MIRRIVMAAAIGSLALSAAACNTVKGAGEDIQSVGEAGEEAIN
nr:entericidin A/B family lipoprotein [Croceicoccus sediminis]